MTLTLTLTPERETRLQEQARQAGLPLEEYALHVLDGAADTLPAPELPSIQTLSPTLALYAQWAEEDRTDDPQEIARRTREDMKTAAQLRQNRFTLEGRTDLQRLTDSQGDEVAA